MDEPGQSANQFPYTSDPDKASRMMNRPTSILGNQVATPTSQEKLVQHQPSYQQFHQQQQPQSFWAIQRQEIRGTTYIKNHCLPLARIKKIMKADRDVKMIAAEAPVLFARACEMFITELTHRSWAHAEENKRRTLLKDDIAGAIARSDILDFLEDIMPRDELKDEDDPLAYHYVAPQGSFMGMIMGNSEVDPEFLCPQEPQPYVPEQQVWEQQQTVQQVQWQPEDEYAQQQLWEQQLAIQQQKRPEDYS